MKERLRLDDIASRSSYSRGVNLDATRQSFRIASRYLSGETVLELGPAEGVMTELLVTTGMKLTLVEGALDLAEDLRRRFPAARVVHGLFEEYCPTETFDNIILGHVLEHVEDPVDLVRRASRWLDPDNGRMFAAVPNAHSIHRQAAVQMGLLETEDELNEQDVLHGHRRVFNMADLLELFREAGAVVEASGGYWLKPLSNRQIEDSWTAEMIAAFMVLGERYPDIAGEIYVVASSRC